MPTTITPGLAEIFPPSMACPADGDLANAASVNNAFQLLLNSSDMTRKLLYGKKLRPRYSIINQGPPGQLGIQPLGQVLVTDGTGNWVALSHNVSSTVNLNTAFGGAVPAKTRIYIYAQSNAGVIQFVATVNPPDVFLQYENGGTTRAYIGTVLSTTVADTFYREYEYGGIHSFDDRGFEVLTAGNAGVATFVQCANPAAFGLVVPTYAKTLKLWTSGAAAVLVGDEAVKISSDAAQLNAFSISCPVLRSLGGGADESVPMFQELFMTTNDDLVPTGGVYYKWQVGGGAQALNLWVSGWVDPR